MTVTARAAGRLARRSSIGLLALAAACGGYGPVTNAQLEGQWVAQTGAAGAQQTWSLTLAPGTTGDVEGTGTHTAPSQPKQQFTVTTPARDFLRFTLWDGSVHDVQWSIAAQSCAPATIVPNPLPDPAVLYVITLTEAGAATASSPVGTWTRPQLPPVACTPQNPTGG